MKVKCYYRGIIMNLNNDKDIQVFITMFVHYPETLNSNSISNNFNKFFVDNNLFDLFDNLKCHVEIKSAPGAEEEFLKIEINLGKYKDNIFDKEKLILILNKYVNDSFKIKIVNVLFIGE